MARFSYEASPQANCQRQGEGDGTVLLEAEMVALRVQFPTTFAREEWRAALLATCHVHRYSIDLAGARPSTRPSMISSLDICPPIRLFQVEHSAKRPSLGEFKDTLTNALQVRPTAFLNASQ